MPRQPQSSTLPALIEISPPPPTGRSDGAQVAQQHRPPPRQHATPEEMARFKAGGPGFALAVPKPVLPDPAEDDRSELYPPAKQAKIIETMFFSAEMATAIGTNNVVNVHGFRAFLDVLMLETGTTDPLEIMHLEQLAMTHFQIGKLYRLASGVLDPKSVEAFINAACHLMAEYRRGVIARAKYRQTTGKRPGRKSSRAARTEKKEASEKNRRSHQTGK